MTWYDFLHDLENAYGCRIGDGVIERNLADGRTVYATFYYRDAFQPVMRHVREIILLRLEIWDYE